jgi:hypothetical protein
MSEFADKIRTLGIIGSTPPARTIRNPDGRSIGVSRTDDNNAVVTERDSGTDVTIRPRSVSVMINPGRL